jgi:WhiB family transcriptional regulator, redox-sensing transcriptional regulator
MTRAAPPPEWMDAAACRGMDTNRFFTEGTNGKPTRASLPLIAGAKQVCAGCEVRLACATYALDEDIEFGVWGGLSQEERRKIRAKRNRQALLARIHNNTLPPLPKLCPKGHRYGPDNYTITPAGRRCATCHPPQDIAS